MNPEEIEQLSDEELVKRFKSIKPSPLFDAFFIGFLVGIIIYGVAANTYGFFMLAPLFLIYQFLKNPKRYNALKAEIQKRKLEPNSNQFNQ